MVHLYESWIELNSLQCEEVISISNDGSHAVFG